MAAPTPAGSRSSRAPTGRKIDQGFSIVVVNSINPAIDIWEETVKPPGIEGGDAIETSTQLNSIWHTTRPRALKKSTNMTIKAQFDADALSQLLSMINVEATITVFFPDGDTYAFYGYYKNFIMGDFKEGDKPVADVEVVVTNWDYTNSVEAGPVFTQASGT